MKQNLRSYRPLLILSIFLFSCSQKHKSTNGQSSSPEPVKVVDIKDENACWIYFKNKKFRYADWGLAFDDKNKVSFYNLKSDPYYIHGKLLYEGHLEVGTMYYTYSRNLILHPSQGRDWNIRLSEDGTFIDQSDFSKYEVAQF